MSQAWPLKRWALIPAVGKDCLSGKGDAEDKRVHSESGGDDKLKQQQ